MLQSWVDMHALFTDLQRLVSLWRVEHAQVASEARVVNLRRARKVAPVVVAINLVFVLWLVASLLGHAGDALTTHWKQGLVWTHLLMGLSFGLLTWVGWHLRYAHNSWLGQNLPLLMVCLALGFVVGVVTIDQWMTPNITPFVIGSLATSLVVYLRPTVSAWVFAAAFGLFSYAIGLTQANAELLLSNRINGLAACVMGWALSLLLWRKFTTITLQQAQLEKANADLQAKQRELQRLTRLDGLTGLYNRTTFVELTRQELARAQRQSSATSILLLDLDFFKHVNDSWGHPAGDAVLKNVATVASSTVRHTDLVGRLGGEEFIVLLPNTSLEAARKLAEKLRTNLAQVPTQWEKSHIFTTVSIGLASTTAAEQRDFDDLYASADKALYMAKEKGRNRVV